MSYEKVIEDFAEIRHIGETMGVLHWDMSTNMPEKGAQTRADKMAVLTKILHQKTIDDAQYKNVCDLIESDEFAAFSDLQKAELKFIKETREEERKIPEKLAVEFARTTAMAEHEWQSAKASGDDSKYLTLFEKIIGFKKEYASLYGYDKNPYDALLNHYDKGLNYDYIEPVFNSLKKELVEIIANINKVSQVNDSFMDKEYDVDKQWEFGMKVLKDFGIDFSEFRIDKSAHPFTIGLGVNDTRITTRLDPVKVVDGISSTLHEGGHALYEMGSNALLGNSPCSIIESLSLHESQSRFYENMIGKSMSFWKTYFPVLKGIFPGHLKDVSIEDFYKAANKVVLSEIRVEADEVTYNLHIILRTELENALINDRIKIKDINEAWNEKFKEMFAYYPESKSTGYLQDVHWSAGLFGYFPTYTLGTLISAQFNRTMQSDLGQFESYGPKEFEAIQGWLKKNFYKHGNMLSVKDFVNMLTGEDLNAQYFTDYLKDKFYKIYRI